MSSEILLCLPSEMKSLFRRLNANGARSKSVSVSRVAVSGTLKNMDVFAERTGTYLQRVPETATRIADHSQSQRGLYV
ncbi:MAG: hypothetical protein AWU57_3311 [Marinobacter sp. T13-3]|nr:MAG: hypothetical protein AWU57_3311 [Marinobacter sp. T13-3]